MHNCPTAIKATERATKIVSSLNQFTQKSRQQRRKNLNDVIILIGEKTHNNHNTNTNYVKYTQHTRFTCLVFVFSLGLKLMQIN